LGVYIDNLKCVLRRNHFIIENNILYLLVSGGGNVWAHVIPGGVIEHLRNMSDSTVAH